MNASLSSSDLRARILGCWLGKCIGGTLGAPTEGLPGPLSFTYYDPMPTGMAPNDDLDLQIVWLECLRRKGFPVSPRDLADAWHEHVHFYPDEYGIASNHFTRGLYPPFSGAVDNPFRDGMGCAIRTELWACLAPGRPDVAVALATADGCADHSEAGLDAARFLAALQSLAFVESDRDRLLDAALAYVQEGSRLGAAVTDARSLWSETGGDWAETRRILRERHLVQNWTDVALNLAYLVLGWLAGDGDFGASICAAVNCGADTDCTGASLGAILGILDPDGIPERWKTPIGREIVLSPSIVGIHPPADLDALTDEVIALREKLESGSAPATLSPGILLDPRASVLSERPIRLVLRYPASGAFEPNVPADVTLRIENPTSTGIKDLAISLCPPRNWKVACKDGALGPFPLVSGEVREVGLKVVAPADELRPHRNTLAFRLSTGGLSWDVLAGLPLTMPWTINGRRVELPAGDVPLASKESRVSIRFHVPHEGRYRVIFTAPTRVRFALDGKLLAINDSGLSVPAVHRTEGAHADLDLVRGEHTLCAILGPAPADNPAATARFAVGDPDTWRLIENLATSPAPFTVFD